MEIGARSGVRPGTVNQFQRDRNNSASSGLRDIVDSCCNNMSEKNRGGGEKETESKVVQTGFRDLILKEPALYSDRGDIHDYLGGGTGIFVIGFIKGVRSIPLDLPLPDIPSFRG